MKHVLIPFSCHPQSCVVPGFLVIIFLLFAGLLQAQTTSIQLSTVDTSSSFRVLDNTGLALLKLNADGGLYILGNTTTGTIPLTGAGTRLMWYPNKKAFRVGEVNGSHWDDSNIGSHSIAMGNNTRASGSYSVAMSIFSVASGTSSIAIGQSTTASGGYSTAIGYSATAVGERSTALGYSTSANGISSLAMGQNTTASGDYSTAMGESSLASGLFSTAIGSATISSGENSTAMGYFTIASGFSSTAMGWDTKASGDYSTAMGGNTTASGRYSTAIGRRVSTDSLQGACIIGDNSATSITNSSAEHEMTMRFAGGYRLYSSADLLTGVYMSGGASGWTGVCDRNKKENFCSINGEQILLKIREMPITKWNYKGTDPTVQYIGPVAQDFYLAFRLGGNDSLGINSICIDGVNIAAIQALEKRTVELKTTVNELQKANEKISFIERNNKEMQRRIERLENIIASMTIDNNKQLTLK